MYSNTYTQYKDITLGAKVLYSFMLNRTLDWTDNPFHAGKQHYNSNDEVYVSFPLEEAMDLLQYSKNKTLKCYKELLELGMITQKSEDDEYYVLCNEDMLKYKNIS